MSTTEPPSEQELEEWRPIANIDGRYEVSNLGRLRSLDTRWNPRRVPLIVTPAKGKIERHSYDRYRFRKNGKRVTLSVHTLVLETFLGPRPSPLHQAAHNDGNHRNNRLSNLRWATPKENSDDCKKHQRMVCGSRHPFAKLTETKVRKALRLLSQGVSQKEVALHFGVAPTIVSRIYRGISWTHVTN